MDREESGFLDVEEEDCDDTPVKKAEDERRSKATALWRARQKRNASSSTALDSVDLSRCEFLQDDEEKRDLYRLQIERAQGVGASRDGLGLSLGAAGKPSQDVNSTLGSGIGSKSTLEGSRPDAGASRSSKFPPLQVTGKKAASRSGLLDPDVVPEHERRRLCLGRKEAYRRCGTSIGRWAFAAELSMGSRSNEVESVTAPKAGAKSNGGLVSVRRKRSRNQEPSALATASLPSAKAQPQPKKKPKRSRQGLLDILGSMPKAGR